MSILKNRKIQLGNHADASNNFVLMVPDMQNGILEIRRGNYDVPGALLVKINADGGLDSRGPAFTAYHSAVQTIAQSSLTRISMQSKEYDYGSCFNNTNANATLNGLDVPPYSFCPNVAGIYRITAGARIATTQTVLETYIRVNLSTAKNGPVSTGMASGYVSAEVYLNGTGDFVDFAITQAAAAQNLATGKAMTYFQASFVRAV